MSQTCPSTPTSDWRCSSGWAQHFWRCRACSLVISINLFGWELTGTSSAQTFNHQAQQKTFTDHCRRGGISLPAVLVYCVTQGFRTGDTHMAIHCFLAAYQCLQLKDQKGMWNITLKTFSWKKNCLRRWESVSDVKYTFFFFPCWNYFWLMNENEKFYGVAV